MGVYSWCFYIICSNATFELWTCDHQPVDCIILYNVVLELCIPLKSYILCQHKILTRANILQGNAAYKGKQYNKAVSYYTEAIKLNESNATFYSNRAAAYLELGWYTFASCSQRISWYASSHYIQRLLLLTDNIFFFQLSASWGWLQQSYITW